MFYDNISGFFGKFYVQKAHLYQTEASATQWLSLTEGKKNSVEHVSGIWAFRGLGKH